MKVCYLLVTCSREASRDRMLRAVAKSIKESPVWERWKDHFYVFDNDSSFEGTKDYLSSEFDNVLFADENYGYWSAVNWFADFAQSKSYDFVYIIESDCVHYDMHQLDKAIELMSKRDDIGMVRTAEFSVENRHLYDKANRVEGSRTHEWFTQRNAFTGEAARYIPTDVDGIFETNLVAKVCGLHRIEPLKRALQNLPDWFTEVDFQKNYHEFHTKNAILDGGIYHTALSYEDGSIGGSWLVEKEDQTGYRKTREGFVTPIENMKVNSGSR